MIQIKTVIQPITQAQCFDALVNCLLIDGWKLNKRKIINVPGELSDSFNSAPVQFLYAELERQQPLFEEVTL